MENKEVTIDDIYNHIATEMVSAVDGRKCVDGRYESGEESGRLARPGGDFGYVMALLEANQKKNLGLTPEQCVDAVYKAVTENNGQFYMHTDEHAEHAGPHTIGCGHISKAIINKEDEEFAAAVAQALQYTRGKMADGKIHMATLTGEHLEQGVLEVTGTKKTVNPIGRFFVYDKTRDIQFLQELFHHMQIKDLEFKNLADAAERQTQATLKQLAPGLPVFKVNTDSETKPEVTPAGHVAARPLDKAA